MQNTRDPWCVVRRIRLKCTAPKALFKCHLPVQSFVDRICLIAVCDDCLVAKHTHRRVNNQARILELRRIKCLRADALSVFDKDTVAAVRAAAHDKIRRDGFSSIRRSADQDASARI